MWWYMRIGMFAGPGHGVPGIHGGVGDTVGVGVGVSGDGDGVALGARVRERVVDGEGDGPASLLEPQATSSEASARQAQRAAARLDRQTRAAERGLAAIAGVERWRTNMRRRFELGLLVILLEITPGSGGKESPSFPLHPRLFWARCAVSSEILEF
jgi:hypothetical protein